MRAQSCAIMSFKRRNPMTDEQTASKADVEESKRAEKAKRRDLSRDIEQAVDREPMDVVRCVRVSGDFYRCNWWCRLGGPHQTQNYDWAAISTDFIRQSSFLKATL